MDLVRLQLRPAKNSFFIPYLSVLMTVFRSLCGPVPQRRLFAALRGRLSVDQVGGVNVPAAWQGIGHFARWIDSGAGIESRRGADLRFRDLINDFEVGHHFLFVLRRPLRFVVRHVNAWYGLQPHL